MTSDSDAVDPVSADAAATVTYIGHAAFLWKAPDGTRVLVDPYQDPDEGSAWFEGEFPEIETDLVVSTHDHFDHNAVALAAGDPAIMTGAGEFETRGIRVTAVPEVHAGKWVMPNSLVVIETGGVRYLHCGDNRFDVAPEAAAAVGEVDVIMVPVDDSSHLLSTHDVWQLATTFSPKVIVPMHYLIPGVVTKESTLLGIENWLASLPNDVAVKRLPGDEITVRHEDLPTLHEDGRGIEVWAFEGARANA